MLRQKSITEFFSLRTLPANTTVSDTSLSPPPSSPPPSSPTSSPSSRPGGESTPPEDIFNNDEPDYIRYEQHGTNGMMEWTFRLARQRNHGFAPKECAWCFITIADAEVLYKCSLDEACLKGLFACQSCILIAHKQHPEHGFVDMSTLRAVDGLDHASAHFGIGLRFPGGPPDNVWRVLKPGTDNEEVH
ncbi:hypothetical protein C8F01DRAFT_1263632 [Mycena amicta]|nr:hypothetical protein C8F01DRAFT_1263632 [Mycena amicta]